MVYLRILFCFLWLLLSCAIGLVLCVFRWGDRNLDRDFARIFSWGILKITGIQVHVEGAENLSRHQPCIYVANHQSGLDMATFGSIYPCKTIVIGKKELKWIPLFGLFFAASGNIMIDRKKRDHAISGLSQAVEAMKTHGVSIWIFPEGTRNQSGRGLLPFKKGAFHMAIAGGVPIVPILSAPLENLVSWESRKLNSGKVKIQVLSPISTEGMNSQDVDRLSSLVRDRMLEALRGLS
jgi:1-acyl-sn-glycerol-3-phosphate acyltransferase